MIKTFVLRSYYIPSDSMNNTLLTNDRVVVDELYPHIQALQRGDVVVFSDPGGWAGQSVAQTPLQSVMSEMGLGPASGTFLIKRIIGLPGDHVTCCNATGHLTVNGVPLAEPYILRHPGDTAADPDQFSVVVPSGKLWVMGDNRDESADSAYHYSIGSGATFVPISDVTGRAVVVSWPIARWAWLGNYSNVFQHIRKSTAKAAGGGHHLPSPT